MDLGGKSVLEASNLTFMYNTAGTGGGNPGSAINLHFLDYGQEPSKINNSILWYGSSPPSQNQIRLDVDSEGYLQMWYSDTQTGIPAGVGSYYNKVNQDPLFVDPENNDYRLRSCSPCIDGGNKNLRPADELDLDADDDLEELIPLDLDEESRVIGPNSKLDMGAYEYLFECPSASSVSAYPASGTLDARRPHPHDNNTLEYREGIGDPSSSEEEDKIAITLLSASEEPVCRASLIDCWELCETGVDTVEDPPPPDPPEIPANYIESISERSGSPGVYDVTLYRAISAGHWTTITYAGGGEPVVYSSLPADANADGTSSAIDILALIDHLNGQYQPPMTIWQCDMDHTGVCNAADILVLIDLLNGADTFIPWLGMHRAPNTCMGDGLLGGSGGLESEDVDTQEFADWFVNYLTSAGPEDGAEDDDFQTIVKALTQWCVNHFAADEGSALADRLSDPKLDFVSDAGRIAAEEVAAALAQ